MTTCVVVKKNAEIAIAADSLVTFGDTRLAPPYEENDKIFKIGDSYLAMAGSAAHFPVLRKLFANMTDVGKFDDRAAVFETFSQAHEVLKDKFFLNTKEDEDDPYESSQITCMVASPGGIFGVYSYREVFSFERFWSIGSGRSFAIGAMYAAYDKLDSAREIAELGVQAGIEFDRNSGGPIRIYSFNCDEVKAAIAARTNNIESAR